MKSFFSVTLFIAAAIAQSATIGLPTENQEINPGTEVVVQVQRPNSLSGSTEVGIAIGLSSCASAPCRSAEDILGTILYNGPFSPVYHETNLPPYENFTITVPASATVGKSQINVAHAALIGAGPSAFLESFNQTVFVI
ncbi:hypothetical protein CBS147332_5120 [Penicillium roqueforti]|nr:hypothetical protein CBS147332_5120 [Penicillium roqueforti]KAI3119284.1 hypothetical protein CBS147331_2696 [Penicillium roqueforti]